MLGLEHLQVPGPVLAVGNHISHLDPVYSAVFLRKSGRWPHIMAKASLWKIPVVGPILKATQQIPVERGGGRGQVGLDAAIEALHEGKLVFIYPDGTISRDPEHWPMRPRPGVAALALSVPDLRVVPVAIWGTQEIVPPYAGKFRPWPRKDVIVAAGPPVPLDDLRGMEHDTRVVRDASIRIMTAVRDLLAEIRDEPAPVEFYDPKKAERMAKRAAGS
ncbi:1-acyl-sn-glycerol-3-phosphate acyltransferase [Nakamurella sp. YIM 132087]|uniref:1-acyl-sn-glycerol-3-phosphate acyltransferase n=2 Tax=Nakamurella alba TaxID=2665158 RepID=A0A7K1FG87_9ACTN|nr:1-acyl-sn-glycerol-3-phosphate acyltransferase [Nakamurella alba]